MTEELSDRSDYSKIFQFTPRKRQSIEIPVARLPTQTLISLPVTIIHGRAAGPRLWLSAAIHGDELNGVEIIRQVIQQIDPKRFHGTLIAVPIVNVFGFIEESRYLPDRRDLNRYFPGSTTGSLASRLAHLFMTEIVHRSTHGLDLHTASDRRTNLPQIRANLEDQETHRCARAFAAPVTIHANTRDGSLRQAAAKQGIPVLVYEAGEASRFNEEAIKVGIAGIFRVMAALEMTSPLALCPPPKSLEVKKSKWVRAARSGLLRLEVKLGEWVVKRQILGSIGDAFGDRTFPVRASVDGLIISHTHKPLVNQGDALFHIAVTDIEKKYNLA